MQKIVSIIPRVYTTYIKALDVCWDKSFKAIATEKYDKSFKACVLNLATDGSKGILIHFFFSISVFFNPLNASAALI